MTFEFDRYINGQLMAEGVTIERQGNLPDAMRAAARIASRGPNGEVPVLVHRAEALSRTGAVKVKALEWEERKTRLGTVWWRAPNPLGGLSIEAASENDKIAAQADYERRILSALEPAAPEGQQPVTWRWKPKDSAAWIYDPKHEWLEAQSSDEIDAEPLYTRPTEQAVTEAMVRAAAEILIGRVNAPEQEIYSAAAAALKAAMEAGRHD